MFLDGYKRNWLENEGYSFEDKMIDDLSVSVWFICFSFNQFLGANLIGRKAFQEC